MTITLNADYDVTLSTALLGYVGETNARPISVEGMEIDGADRYVLTIDYGDGVAYEVDITGGQWTPTADILRSAQTISCQIAAKKLAGDEYILLKKSRIFRLRIGVAIGNNAVPSPDVAMDALDRIDAIGRQAHADMQTAVTAAETATTSAENAKKSATAAEKSADTATQAASRAETAQASAETSATQADTARQGAETARAEAVTSQNNAKISAAQASTAAQQTTADKTITAGYAKTAKTCADSTTADRQAVQDMAEQVTADKATVADHATKVAEDRATAEIAAQTAQAIADSLPDDYVTAVGKIAENTAEISAVKLTDKELTRRVNALYDMGNGITHKFETDSETAYQKTVPTGAKLMSVKSIGGRNLVFNQIVNPNNFRPSYTVNGVTITRVDGYKFVANGTATGGDAYFSDSFVPIKGHVYLEKSCPKGGSAETYRSYITGSNVVMDTNYGSGVIAPINVDTRVYIVPLMVKSGVTVNNLVVYPQIYDLTAMFGSGNEPASVEEFEKMFPADYYPYNTGAVVSAGVTEVAVGDTAYPIPEAIRNLPGYGWSAGTARNYVDYENKRYAQCVSSVDLGTLDWTYGKTPFGWGDNQWFSAPIQSIKVIPVNTQLANVLCKKYTTRCAYVADGNDFFRVDKSIGQHQGNAGVTVLDTAYTDTAAFKQAMQGVVLYYELESPIVTDISNLIDDDFLRNLTVEAGGSVTFKNSNDDSYRIPVPSEEEYIVKLSEVGGTT